MNIILTTHAKERMAERTVTMEQIRYTLERPDVKMDTSVGVEHRRKLPDGRELKVWLVRGRTGPTTVVVKSVAWRGW